MYLPRPSSTTMVCTGELPPTTLSSITASPADPAAFSISTAASRSLPMTPGSPLCSSPSSFVLNRFTAAGILSIRSTACSCSTTTP